MTTPDSDAAAAAEQRFQDATDALHNASTNGNGGSAHSGAHVADHVSIEIDEAKQHAESAIDTALQSAVTAVKGARTTYQQNPKKVLATVSAVAIGILVLVTLLRRR